MADHFVKIYASILDSSIWLEPAPTRLVWITLLAMADEFGVVRASVGGLAHRARVDKAECEAAIETLLSPDPDSGSSDYEGRRIAVIDGGWEVLNALKYREKRSKRQIQNAEAAERRRARERADQEMEAPDPEEAKPAKKTKPAKKAAAPDSEVEWRVAATWTSFLAARAEFLERVNKRPPTNAPTLTAEVRDAIVEALREHDADRMSAETRGLWMSESPVLAAGEGLFLDPWHTGTDPRNSRRYLEPWRPWKRQRGKADPVERFAELAFEARALRERDAPKPRVETIPIEQAPAWKKALGQLRRGISPDEFALWIEPLEVLRVDDESLTLLAPSSAHARTVGEHYGAEIFRAAAVPVQISTAETWRPA